MLASYTTRDGTQLVNANIVLQICSCPCLLFCNTFSCHLLHPSVYKAKLTQTCNKCEGRGSEEGGEGGRKGGEGGEGGRKGGEGGEGGREEGRRRKKLWAPKRALQYSA